MSPPAHEGEEKTDTCRNADRAERMFADLPLEAFFKRNGLRACAVERLERRSDRIRGQPLHGIAIVVDFLAAECGKRLGDRGDLLLQVIDPLPPFEFGQHIFCLCSRLFCGS